MRWIAAVFLTMLLAGHAQADPLPEADRQVIVTMIRDQMEAFRRDDADAAFAFASPTIQGLFGNDPNRFMAMVRQGYPPVYRPRSAEFGELEQVDGRVMQRVLVTGPDGVARTAIYTLEHEPDGSWRIGGCVLSADISVGA